MAHQQKRNPRREEVEIGGEEEEEEEEEEKKGELQRRGSLPSTKISRRDADDQSGGDRWLEPNLIANTSVSG
jgi:hypothetical protein